LYDDGVAAVVAPGFAPKRNCAPIGEAHVTTGGAAVSRLAKSATLTALFLGPALV
jgi:hypothetical protein